MIYLTIKIILYNLPMNKSYNINPYSVLTPPEGFLFFPKIPNQINILLITAC
jgi:hypothetical protein